LETESLVEHVEGELVGWLRRRMLIPGRLTRATKVARPVAAKIADVGNKSARGEAIVARMEQIGAGN
jgi:hypothetical protein